MDTRPGGAVPGRLPNRVYWARRALVLVVLLLIVAVVWWLVAAVSGSPRTASPALVSSTSATASTDTPSDSPTPMDTDTPTTGATPPAASTPTTAATSTPPAASATTPAAPIECAANLLSLSVTGPNTVAASATAEIQVSITNTGQSPCIVTFDNRFTLRIVSGTDEVWSTGDCPAWMASGSQTLTPGAAATWKTTWDRHRSQKECKVVPTTLKSGTYVANAMYTGSTPANWVLLLTA